MQAFALTAGRAPLSQRRFILRVLRKAATHRLSKYAAYERAEIYCILHISMPLPLRELRVLP
jgi:hypothetical protein